MSVHTLGVPGAPALAPTYIAEATQSGPFDVALSLLPAYLQAQAVTPKRSFSLNSQAGLIPFYKGMPRVIDAGKKQLLLKLGGATYATGQLILGSTITPGDIITTTIIYGATTATVNYTVVSGDTTLTILAGHVAGAIAANGTANVLVSAAGSGADVNITSLLLGSAGNSITIKGSLSGGATETYTPTTNTALTGGTNGSYIV